MRKIIVAVLFVVVLLAAIVQPCQASRIVYAKVTYHVIRRGTKTAFGKKPTAAIAATNKLKEFPRGRKVTVIAYKSSKGWKPCRVTRTIADKMGPRHRKEPIKRIDLYVFSPSAEIRRISGKICKVRIS